MEEFELKRTIAKNIVELRRSRSMTQAELAERLCYSDKAISKWERAESVPDVFILKKVAEIFSVSLDYLTESHDGEKVPAPSDSKHKGRNHLLISLMSAGLVWLIATAVYVILKVTPVGIGKLWLAFVFAVPLCLIVLLVFNSIWGRPKGNYIIISLLMWSILASICLSMIDFNVWLILVIGAPGQVIILLWSGMIRKKRDPKKEVPAKKEKIS